MEEPGTGKASVDGVNITVPMEQQSNGGLGGQSSNGGRTILDGHPNANFLRMNHIRVFFVPSKSSGLP
jgi:hypothetical protein